MNVSYCGSKACSADDRCHEALFPSLSSSQGDHCIRNRGQSGAYVAKFNLGYEYVDLLESGTIHIFDLTRFLMGDVLHVNAQAVNKYAAIQVPV